jgi:hypothetical protein
MPVPVLITDLSQTAASNYPQGSDSPSTLDDVQRADGSFIAMLRDGKGLTNPVILASAGTTDIGGQNSLSVEISGTTTITSFGTNYNGPRYIKFQAALTLTYNATSLIIPGAASITTGAGDTCIAIPNQALNGWTVANYVVGSLTPGTSAYGSGIVATTAMTFQQTSAPTGWTKVVTHNDKALRVVSGTASSGGSVAFSTAFASQAVGGTVGGTTLSSAQLPAHTHGSIFGSGDGAGATNAFTSYPNSGYPTFNNTNSVIYTVTSDGGSGGGSSHTHTFTGTAINLAVNYVDMIIATKS